MKVIEDLRYRCDTCGEPLLRDGGNRHIKGQSHQVLMCINGVPGACADFGKRMRVPLAYVQVQELFLADPTRK